MINIHSEERPLEGFMKDLEESMKGNLPANYQKSLPLHDGFLTREASPVSDDEPQIVNSYV